MLLRLLLPFPLLAFLSSATSNENYTCPEHLYNIQIFTQDPLVIYIPNFITEFEAEHIQKVVEGRLTRSRIADQSGQQHLAQTRTSHSTSLPSDPIVSCIESRALSFQSLSTPRTRLEPLQAVQYSLTQHYHAHTDWFTNPLQTTPSFGGNRVSSFFVYVSVSDDIMGGGTQFPMLEAPSGEEWCGVVNCDASLEEGVVFRPVARNAVFWRNMKDGKGDQRTLHAGLPVQRGTKLGMNVWTREGALDEQYRAGRAE